MRIIKIVAIVCCLAYILSSCKLSKSNNEQEQVLYNIPKIETTTSAFHIAEKNKIRLSTIDFIFPEEYEITSSNGEVVLQNKIEPIQITIEDKTSENIDLKEYIQDNINSLKQLGLSPQKIESVKLGEYLGERFIVDTFDITNEEIRMFCYFLEINNSKVLINIISENGAIVETEDADDYVCSIKFE